MMKTYKSTLILLLLVLLTRCQSNPSKNNPFAIENHLDFAAWGRTNTCCVATGQKVAVASGGTRSSQAGMQMFDAGGNSVDAAVAVAFALAVERPHSAGIGGGGFMTLHLADAKEKDIFIDFR